mmetsp:Transcript_89843/g.254588  ORF Transcript_89843/g.254588 Transcript_89843/m.254588 type:complete len:318 (-) Transcript_89843:485-1438(-)
MASPSSSSLIFEKSWVRLPTFSTFSIRLAMSCWSAKTGVMMVGQPAPSEACVVPIPPWCTAALHCGNSHSCGADFRKRTFFSLYAFSSSAFSAPSRQPAVMPAQPPRMMPRLPAYFRAPTARRAIHSLEYTTMEPQPRYTGGSPALKNAMASSLFPKKAPLPPDISLCTSLVISQRPTTSMPPFPGLMPPCGHSFGAAQKAGLKAHSLMSPDSSMLKSSSKVCSGVDTPRSRQPCTATSGTIFSPISFARFSAISMFWKYLLASTCADISQREMRGWSGSTGIRWKLIGLNSFDGEVCGWSGTLISGLFLDLHQATA